MELRRSGKSRHPKIYILDTAKNTEENITFKKEIKWDKEELHKTS